MAILYNRQMKAYACRIIGHYRLHKMLVSLTIGFLIFVLMANSSTIRELPPDCYRKPPPLPFQAPPKTAMFKFYPKEGTGEPFDISQDFDSDIFNPFCKTHGPIKAVLPIYSTVDNFEKRTLLRESLGRLAKKLRCRIFFIVGMSKNTEINKRLKDEYKKEKDVLVVGKIDTYRDLNNKAAAMVEWIDKYCQNVPYVIHLIDDAYVNLQRWLKRLDHISDFDYIFGTWTDTPSERHYWIHRSFVTVEEYPYPRFPVYAYGYAFAFPSRTASRLRSAMYNATYCWIEDVWIAGHVRETAGVKLVPLREDEWGQGNWTCTRKKKKKKEHLKDYLLWHTVSDEDLKNTYQVLIDGDETSPS